MNYNTLKKRIRRALKEANPRPNDTILYVARPTLYSFVGFKALYEIEKNFPKVQLDILEFMNPSEKSCLRQIAKKYSIKYTSIVESFRSYTEIRCKAFEEIRGKYKDPLIVMSDTADDLTLYLISEILQGYLKGLNLDLYYRVAYILGQTTREEIGSIKMSEKELCDNVVTELVSNSYTKIIDYLVKNNIITTTSSSKFLKNTIKLITRENRINKK